MCFFAYLEFFFTFCSEFNELNSSLALLKQLVERRKIPVFSDVPEAVHFVAKVSGFDDWELYGGEGVAFLV